MFASIQKLPADPILGLTVAYKTDSNPNKIDLGAGVYKDETGNTPIFAAVKKAEALWQQEEDTKVYTSQPGFADFNEHIQQYIFGSDHKVLTEQRVCSVMAPGGSGALRLAAELINRCQPGASLWVSKPTWGNHIPLLSTAGVNIKEYPYYDTEGHGILFDEMLATLKDTGPDDVVLFHGCCHNPTGADLSVEQWQAVAKLAQERGFLPFIDTAYQGLGEGLEEDVYGVRLMAESVPELIVAYSCSKNFGLYRERIGVILTVGKDKEAADVCLSHITNIARTMYSLPPSHGGAIVKTILENEELYGMWRQELDAMRERINSLRGVFADMLGAKTTKLDFSFIKQQHGMFSFLGISKEQVHRLRDEFSIYLVDSSRINIAGISPKNMEYLTDSIVKVL